LAFPGRRESAEGFTHDGGAADIILKAKKEG
jgi:hypothetical protein